MWGKVIIQPFVGFQISYLINFLPYPIPHTLLRRTCAHSAHLAVSRTCARLLWVCYPH